MFYVRVLMEWTTEKPTQEGWYWTWDGYTRFMVEITIPDPRKPLVFVAMLDGEEYGMSAITHFIGPLPEPEPPLP